MEIIKELIISLDKMPKLSKNVQKKKDMFLEILNYNPINLNNLQKLSFNGIPDDLPQLRSIIWKILLGYLPLDKNLWNKVIEKNHDIYYSYLKEFVENDHPLSNKKDSNWNSYFKNLELYDEIQKDTLRTRSEMHMFVSDVQDPIQLINVFKKQKKPIMHYEVLTRILFIFAKLNSGIKYVQGMNELLAPLYFVFQKDKQFLQKNDYELESFFCFALLMSECKDNFLKSLDTSSLGIKAKINDLNRMLKQIDRELWENLEKEEVNPHFYTLRWLMLYLTQEFKLNDVLRLWDSLLSQKDKQKFLNYLCLAIIINMKDELMGQDFSYIMGKLQRFENVDVLNTIIKAQELMVLFQDQII